MNDINHLHDCNTIDPIDSRCLQAVLLWQLASSGNVDDKQNKVNILK